jgi:hypothetical protein
MNYWWVNQKQTYRHEIGEGYMWSPKVQMDGKRHFSYEYMKHIHTGDIIFSYANAAIIAIGVAKAPCYHFPKPMEFGKAGINWSDEGWRVDVKYQKLAQPLRTMDHIDALRSLLPSSKSPMRTDNGGANQAYLFQIDKTLALALSHLIGGQAVALISDRYVSEPSYDDLGTREVNIDAWENKVEAAIIENEDLTKTEKETLVKARRGQGKFRALVLGREVKCRVTGVDKPEHLIASHIKPWRSASNGERLDPENGFMLTPSIDHLFDKGFISFENDGKILLADIVDRVSMERMGVIGESVPKNIGVLTSGQKEYLNWHRDSLLLR